ncbi:MAG: hypothetical protein HY236_08815 [Acidobacteria bacterium]|nr:hypothetical protein [Acidobacteriota bacterium]
MPKKPARRRNVFRAAKEVRKLARERIGPVPAGRTIQPKSRKPTKHPKKEKESWLEN